jgi:hypothetical protein
LGRHRSLFPLVRHCLLLYLNQKGSSVVLGSGKGFWGKGGWTVIISLGDGVSLGVVGLFACVVFYSTGHEGSQPSDGHIGHIDSMLFSFYLRLDSAGERGFRYDNRCMFEAYQYRPGLV